MARSTLNKASGAAFAGDWVANATYPERPAEYDRSLVLETLVQYSIRRRRTVHCYADHGIGKTSKIRQILGEIGLQMVYVNLANITPDDKLVVAPVTDEDGNLALRQLVMEDLTPGVDFAIVLDDARQASRQVQNQFMQLTNDWTIGMHELPGLKAVIMLDNEGAAEGIRTSEDLAVGDRKVTMRLKPNDTGWRYALARKYARTDLSGVFAVWDGLNTDLRHVLSPRCLDHVIYCTLNGFPPIVGLPIVATSVSVWCTSRRRATRRTAPRRSSRRSRPPSGSRTARRSRTSSTRRSRPPSGTGSSSRSRVAPGIGKTAVAKARVKQAGLREVYYSMPFTDPEALIAPMPTKDGKLKALIAEELKNSDPYALLLDEYNRPATPATFAKLMEITQEWSLGGIPLDGCVAQIALCNPSEWQGRKMQVSKGNIAQADRFTISIQVTADDIPANDWLLTNWPDKVSGGDPAERERARSVIETILEWYKNDIGDEHRQWITKRTIERLAELHLDGMPLEIGKIYLGEGEYAPVPLVDLEARLADRPMARLGEMAADIESWEARLEASKGPDGEVTGTNDVDQVHQALSLAELSQLWDNLETVCRLTKFLPRKLKGTFFIGASEANQQFWIAVMAVIAGTKKVGDIVRP